MANIDHGDLTVSSIGGSSVLDYLPDVELRLDGVMDDGSPITGSGERNEKTKAFGSFSASLFSDASGSSRTSNIDVTALTIGGVDYIAYVRGGSFRGTIPNAESSGVGSLWRAPQPHPNRRQYSASVTLQVPAASATANALRLLGAIAGGNREAAQVTFSVTINAVAVTLPMTITSVGVPVRKGENLEITVELVGRAPVSGAYPSAPTGTTTLLEKALNDAKTPLAFAFTPHGDAGFGCGFTGNMVIESFDFAWEDEKIIQTNYSYLTTGAVTPTNT